MATDKSADKWLQGLEESKKRHQSYLEATKRIRKKLIAEEGTANRINMYSAMIHTEAPHLYSRLPSITSDVLWGKKDRVASRATEIVERATTIQVKQHPDYHQMMNLVRFDAQTTGRGVGRVRLEDVKGDKPVMVPVEMTPQGPVRLDGEPLPENPQIQQMPDGVVYIVDKVKDIIGKAIRFEHVSPSCFHFASQKVWEDVEWVCFPITISKFNARERFGEALTNKMTFSRSITDEGDEKKAEHDEERAFALVYEFWDKETQMLVWVDAESRTIIGKKEDNLRLKGFFPTPKPVLFNLVPETLIGQSDFLFFEGVLDTLDALHAKHRQLCEMLGFAGLSEEIHHPQVVRALAHLEQNRNIVEPVNLTSNLELTGGKIVIPIEFPGLINQLEVVTAQIGFWKQQLFELSGSSDLVRGASNPMETARAQELKSAYANARMDQKKSEFDTYASGMISLAGEIIAEHFSDEQLIELAAVEPDEITVQAIQLLRDDKLRRLKVTIESGTQSAIDKQTDREEFSEYLSTVDPVLQTAMQAIQMQPQAANYYKEILTYGCRLNGLGKSVEGAIDALMQRLEELAAQAAQNPQPSLDEQKLELEKQKLELEAQKIQVDLQKAQLAAQAKNQELTTRSDEAVVNAALKNREIESRERQQSVRLG